jgi:hypothetical protein
MYICIIWIIYIDYIQVISRLYCVHKLLLIFHHKKIPKISKTIVNNVKLLQNHCNFIVIKFIDIIIVIILISLH